MINYKVFEGWQCQVLLFPALFCHSASFSIHLLWYPASVLGAVKFRHD